jgi:hypothetical protein
MRDLFSCLLTDDDRKKVADFMVVGCGCTKSMEKGKPCISQFSTDAVLEFRLQCFELDYHSEHENKLNDAIVAELSAVMHMDEKLTCSNKQPAANSSRKKVLIDYMFHGFSICRNAFLFFAWNWQKAIEAAD